MTIDPLDPSMLDPATASIDELIRFLRTVRQQQTDAPLSALVNLSRLSRNRLTDLACIDLIERIRLGLPVRVETLLSEIPILASDNAARLDLIDAELCVRTEGGNSVDVSQYYDRFPDLISEIDALAHLEASSAGPVALTRVISELSFAGLHELPNSTPVSKPGPLSALEHAIQVPPWFCRDQVQATTEQSCLIRGRDATSNRTLALKIVRFHKNSTNECAENWLEAVEVASMVKHPAWLPPEVAMVDDGLLAMVRPWVYGQRWDEARRHASLQVRLRDLARIGYALQAAHGTQWRGRVATHGGVHLNNLLVDATGQVRLVDAIVNLQPAAGEMLVPVPRTPAEGITAGELRRQSDVASLIALTHLVIAQGLAQEAVHVTQVQAIQSLCRSFIKHRLIESACSQIADALMDLADGKVNHQPADDVTPPQGWRRFLSFGNRA